MEERLNAVAAPGGALHKLPTGSSVELTDDPERIDLDALWDFLSTEA